MDSTNKMSGNVYILKLQNEIQTGSKWLKPFFFIYFKGMNINSMISHIQDKMGFLNHPWCVVSLWTNCHLCIMIVNIPFTFILHADKIQAISNILTLLKIEPNLQDFLQLLKIVLMLTATYS